MHTRPLLLATTVLVCAFDAAAGSLSGNGYTLHDATVANRSIVQRALGQPCPARAAGWDVQPLFQADAGGYLPPALVRYCVFDRVSADAVDLSAYGVVGADAIVVAGLAEPDPEEIAWSFEDQAHPFPAYAAVPPTKARLTLIDSSPTADAGDIDVYGVPGAYEHGQQLATLALRAVCDGDFTDAVEPLCVVDLASQLALGYSRVPGAFERSADGGSFGSQADLAAALQRAVLAWHEDAPGAPLVLNVSLGWHPDAGGGEPTLTPAVAAVKEALELASCKDVLTLASVGNVDSPWQAASAEGPLYPAAWEAVAAPSAAACEARYGAWFTADDRARRVAGAGGYTPLLYGVSGFDVSGRTLGNQRPGASTPHAAAGSHLAAYNPTVADYLTPISGTSASTIVVSSAAAVVRSHAPELDAHGVMRVLRDGAPSSSVPAETCYDPAGIGCPPSHAITVCASLASLCDAGLGSACAPAYTAATCDTLLDPEPLAPAGAPEPDVLSLTGLYDSVCGTGLVAADTAALAYACPYEELYGATALPMTLPQPPGGECPWCPAFLDGRVDLVMATSLTKFSNLTITVHHAGAVKHYPLGKIVCPNGAPSCDRLTVFLPVGAVDVGVTKMLLSYTYAGENVAYAEPLYLTW
ncbi:MAG: S8/S53 family peptidase [Myxococcota bacterium]